LRRGAVLSSRIEGAHSELTDLYVYEGGQLALPGLEPVEPENDDLHEVYNYVRTLEAGLAQLEDTPISLWMLRSLYKILLNEVRGHYATPGEFRTRQNWIGGSTINNAIYVPPHVIEMIPALESLEHYFYPDDQYLSLVRLAFIHYQFEAPIITIPIAQKVLDMTYHGAERSVNKLIQLGMLSPMDDRFYGKTFLSRHILETIQGE
jgi:Fic family protein